MPMLPLLIDVSRLRLLLAGNGAAALRRLRLLEQAGAVDLAVFSAAPSPELAQAAGGRLSLHMPSAADLAHAQLVFLADLPRHERTILAAVCRAVGVIVHVEDEPALSDTQMPAVLRRGALTVAVSTGGASPALAVQLRDFLGALFGPEWRERLNELSRQRRAWRKAGAPPDAIAHLTGEWVRGRGWLPTPATRH